MVVKLLTRKKYFLSIIITISQTHKTKQQQKHAIVKKDNKPKDFDYQESTNNTESSKRMVISKYALK